MCSKFEWYWGVKGGDLWEKLSIRGKWGVPFYNNLLFGREYPVETKAFLKNERCALISKKVTKEVLFSGIEKKVGAYLYSYSILEILATQKYPI